MKLFCLAFQRCILKLWNISVSSDLNEVCIHLVGIFGKTFWDMHNLLVNQVHIKAHRDLKTQKSSSLRLNRQQFGFAIPIHCILLLALSSRSGWRLLQTSLTWHIQGDSVRIRLRPLHQHSHGGTSWSHTGVFYIKVYIYNALTFEAQCKWEMYHHEVFLVWNIHTIFLLFSLSFS